MKYKTPGKRILALLMALLLCLPLLPAIAFTEGDITEQAEPAYEREKETTQAEVEEAQDTELAEPPLEWEAATDEPNSGEEPEEMPLPDEETETDETETPALPVDTLLNAIDTNGYAYIQAMGAIHVYDGAGNEAAQSIFTTSPGGVLLATAYTDINDFPYVKVWLITIQNEALAGYVTRSDLADGIIPYEEIGNMVETMGAACIDTEAGTFFAFIVDDEKISTTLEEAPADEPLPVEEEKPDTDDILLANVRDFVEVSTQTRAFMEVDASATEGIWSQGFLGYFVREAPVRIVAVEQDILGNYWYEVKYMYGDDFADGTLKWSDYAHAHVLAAETSLTEARDFQMTDYAFETAPISRLRAATPMNGFTLKSISAPIASLSAGQSGVHGSSGKDSDYLQIASAPGRGTVYATPHYLNGFTVYCLEHNLPGPGENISGGGQQPTGPYVIVDIDTYMNTPGYSSVIYKQGTLHAIAWVLRHTYPFMALDRSDSDNLTWSRVAGQFAIREVIKQMEGAQYVRDYWNLSNFYRASGQAPEVYLTYARWLAENGIARGRITGTINISNKSIRLSNGLYVGTATFTTDADLIRIPKSVGTLSGNSAGSDGSYYYLKSGDTVTVSSTINGFTITAESISSPDEEANFLVGVPSTSIQKVLIPQYGTPYKLKSASVEFKIPYAAIPITKKSSVSGKVLPGAVFELLDGAGKVLQTQTTGVDGVCTFGMLLPGTYKVREKSAPEGHSFQEVILHFVVDETGTLKGDVKTVSNDYTRVQIHKQDENANPLGGALFGLFSEDGKQLRTTVSSDSGKVAFEKIPFGTYTISEIAPPPGYLHNDTVVTLTVDGQFVNPSEPIGTFVNQKIKISGIKVDTSGRPMEGVEFSLIHPETDDVYETVMSDANGAFTFTNLDYGEWIIRETGTPEGFYPAADVLVVVDETWAEPEPISFLNIPNHYSFLKTDNHDGPLAGVLFALENTEGEMLRELVSDEDGVVHITDLTPGSYVIREIEAPSGFMLTSETIEFTIDENYVVPEEMACMVNYPENIQTGMDYIVTPLMLVGAVMMLAAIVMGVVHFIRNRKHKGVHE